MRACTSLILVIMLASFTGCAARNKTNDTELAIGARAQNNIAAVADTLENIPGMVPYSNILKDQLRVLSTAYLITEEDIAELSQEFSLESNLDPVELAQNPQSAAKKSKEQASKDVKDIEESQSNGFWAWAATAGGIAIWAARMLNVPGIGLLTDPIVKTAFGFVTKPLEKSAAQAEKRAQTLALTVESSIVGRSAIAALDKKLGDNDSVRGIISKFTGGSTDSIDGLFTYVARANATDSQKGKQVEVATVLAEIKDTMPTTGSVPSVLSRILTDSSKDA